MKTLTLISIVLLTMSCSKVKTGFDNGKFKDMSDLDGCGLVLELDNGKTLEVARYTSQPSFAITNGKKVRVKYKELPDYASICMMGEIVEITAIEER